MLIESEGGFMMVRNRERPAITGSTAWHPRTGQIVFTLGREEVVGKSEAHNQEPASESCEGLTCRLLVFLIAHTWHALVGTAHQACHAVGDAHPTRTSKIFSAA
jgi:hypothetical protein